MKTLIFGGIGTLVSTSEYHYQAFNEAFSHFNLGWHWGQAEYQKLLVQPGGLARIARYAEQHGGFPEGVSAEKVYTYKNDRYLELVRSAQLTVRPGLNALLAQAEQGTLQLALASTTSTDTIEAVLYAGGIDKSMFTYICDGSQVSEKKPDPEVYFHTLQQLALEADQTVAIEDARSGVMAAKAAGLRCVAYPNTFTADHDYSQADELVEDLSASTVLADYMADGR